ncbi:MAG: ATP synthase F1 subunit gamma [Chloroflexota bacterium]
MASLRDIRRRIRGIRSTAQITKAMELVAASRMRRAQQRVLSARPYSDAMRTFMSQLGAAGSGDAQHPLLVQRPVDTAGILVMTSDRGLCGALNANVLRRSNQLLVQETTEERHDVELITVGRKGQDFMARYVAGKGKKLLGTFTQLGDRPDYDAIIPIARVVMDSYLAGVMDVCYIVYPKFVSTLVQRPEVIKLLPIEPAADGSGAGGGRPVDYIYEPNPDAILETLLPRYVEVQIFQAIIETIASEQSARMVAMRNANENAKDLINNLTLTYNKARQASITTEVLEIAAAAEFMAQQSR